MITKNELKHYSSLLQKKFRDRENKFLAEGIKIVTEGLNSKFNCEAIFVSHRFAETEKEFLSSLRVFKVPVEVLKNPEFLKLTDTRSPQGIAAVFHKYPDKEKKSRELSGDIIVCLENISDPGNLGTIIRNCDWFGVNDILLDKTCADVYNPKTVRSCSGSLFHVNLFYREDIFETLSMLKRKGYSVLCPDLQGENIFEYENKNKSVLIFANEANGPSAQALGSADIRITVPRIGHAESLNVASASAVILSRLTHPAAHKNIKS